MSEQNRYPRITLKCSCGNEFNVNVIRMREREPVFCLICGEHFPVETGEKFAQAFQDLYNVKHMIDREGAKFKYAFVYKSTFEQPPAPYPIDDDEKPEEPNNTQK